MLTTLLIVAGVTNLSTLLGVFGYKKRARTLKKKNEALVVENKELLETVADALSDHVTEDHVVSYAKAAKKANHKWKVLSAGEFSWSGKTDELACFRCEQCNAIQRVWTRGHGAVDQPEAQGIWIDGHKLTTEDSRRFQCQAFVVKKSETSLGDAWNQAVDVVAEARSSKSTSKIGK